MAFGNDSKILYAGIGSSLWKFDISKNSILWKQKKITGSITSMASSTCETFTAASPAYSTIDILDNFSGRLVSHIKDKAKGLLYSMDFSPGGRLLAVGSSDKNVYLLKIPSGQLQATLSGHSKTVRSVAFTTDGKLVASGSSDGTVKIWNVHRGREICSFQAHSRDVNCLVFKPDSSILASGSRDKTIKLWKTSTWELLNTLSAHSNIVESLAFSPDGRLLASGSYNKSIKIWDLETGGVITKEAAHKGKITALVFLKDSSLLASGSSDNLIKLWNPRTGKLEGTLKGHRGDISSISFRCDNQILISSSLDSTIKYWNYRTKKLAATIQPVGNDFMTYTPDGYFFGLGQTIKPSQDFSFRTGGKNYDYEEYRRLHEREDIVRDRLSLISIGVEKVTPDIGKADKSIDITVKGNGFKPGISIHLIPEEPKNIISYFNTDSKPEKVEIKDNYAYLLDRLKLNILDISNPKSPVLSSELELDGASTDIYITGRYVYVSDLKTGIKIINVKNPSMPILEGSYYGNRNAVTSISVSGKYLYCTDIMNGFLVLDISNPKKPEIVGEYKYPIGGNAVYIKDNYAYVSEPVRGLLIFDISDPGKPLLTGILPRTKSIIGIAIKDNFAFLTDYKVGLIIADITNPHTPRIVSVLPSLKYAYSISLKGDLCYIGEKSGITVINVSNPYFPFTENHYPFSAGVGRIKLSNEYAFAVVQNGLNIIHLNNRIKDIHVIDTDTVEVSIPVNTSPGIYNLELVNPDGSRGKLVNAYFSSYEAKHGKLTPDYPDRQQFVLSNDRIVDVDRESYQFLSMIHMPLQRKAVILAEKKTLMLPIVYTKNLGVVLSARVMKGTGGESMKALILAHAEKDNSDNSVNKPVWDISSLHEFSEVELKFGDSVKGYIITGKNPKAAPMKVYSVSSKAREKIYIYRGFRYYYG
ncbi:hypothetical protein ES708_07448 [subsurface metagenome]